MDEQEAKITFEEKFRSWTASLGRYTSGIIAIGIAIWWIFYGMVEITETTLSLQDRVGLTLCTIVLAVSYCNLIADGGFSSAKRTATYQSKTKEWSENIHKVIGDKQAIIKFAKDEAFRNLCDLRRQNIENNEMIYSQFYDETGKFIGHGYRKRKDLSHSQKRVISKINKYKITMPNLFGKTQAKAFGLKKEESQFSYSFKTKTFNFIIRVVLSIISVGIMFNFLGFNWDSMIYAFFQIMLWSASGFSQRLKNFNWVMSVALPQVVEKNLMLVAWQQLPEEAKAKYREQPNQHIHSFQEKDKLVE